MGTRSTSQASIAYFLRILCWLHSSACKHRRSSHCESGTVRAVFYLPRFVGHFSDDFSCQFSFPSDFTSDRSTGAPIVSKRSFVLTLPPAILSLAQFGTAIAFFAKATKVTILTSLISSSSASPNASTLARIHWALTLVTTLSFVAVLANLVHRARARSGPGARGERVAGANAAESVVTYALDAGFLVVICALATLLTGVASPGTMVYMFFMLCLSQRTYFSLF